MIDMTNPGIISSKDASDDPVACCGGGSSRLDHNEATALAGQLSAIADPVRIQMLSIIASSATGEVCACDFVEPIGKSQPTISHHLKVLNAAGIVAGDKRGRWIWYRLAPGSIDDVVSTLVDAVADTPS
jgi:ArsR family transcriptional regulator